MKQKSTNFFDEKNTKITKQSHAYKGYASCSSVRISNNVNTDLQLKDAEYGIRNSLIDLVTRLKGFQFVTKLVLK